MSAPWWWRASRGALFAFDAERVHTLTLSALKRWGPAADSSHTRARRDPRDEVHTLGLVFPNPVGLAAGLDKNAEAVEAWQALGFGFIEVGTVTAHPQPGNDKPRLFRLKRDRALMNRMGFNNDGAEMVGRRLAKLRDEDRVGVPLGINLGKSKVTPNEEAPADYRASFRACAPYADYVVVNVSSPNTPGLRDLQTAESVRALLEPLVEENDKLSAARPLLLKLAPDLVDDDALACATAALDAGCQGLIISNTTISRDHLAGPVPEGSGGVSGAPLFARSTEMLDVIAREVGDRAVLIGVGGIMDADQARKKREAGAQLVQVYSGFIYGGPSFPRVLVEGMRR